MDQIDLDSDCEIQEPNVSTITVFDDSHSEIIEIEDGELDEVDVSNAKLEKEELFTITFQNKNIFHELGHSILNALQMTLNADVNKSMDFKIETANEETKIICSKVSNTDTSITEDIGAEDANDTDVKDPSSESNDTKSSPDDIDLELLFTIDTEPAKKLDTIKVPSYKRAVRDVLEEESKQKKKKNSEDECKRVRTASCFNCGSTEHALFKCPKTRNIKRISKAKKAFCSGRNERYHVDIEQRFAHMRPGVISDKLQSALGLRRGELPFFFYRMRVLGYPPGWLEDAKVSHSGITLFNSSGLPVIQRADDVGEINAENHKYDASKIVGFPGFNVNPGKKFYDDYKHHNVPPLNQKLLREEFIKTLGDKIIKGGYKRKKLVDIPIANSLTVQENECMADMEVENDDLATETNVVFSRPMPPTEEPEKIEVPPPPPPLSSPPAANNGSKNITTPGNRTRSPSLEDLEAQQQKLLQELQNNTSFVSEPAEDSLIDELLEIEANENSVEIIAAETLNSDIPRTPTTPQDSAPAFNTPTTPQDSAPAFNKADIIKESHMGTPILKFSPFDQLPAGENFKVGVSDVINFENLPDSTGKYEQMKIVIKKVRKVITKLYNEDD